MAAAVTVTLSSPLNNAEKFKILKIFPFLQKRDFGSVRKVSNLNSVRY